MGSILDRVSLERLTYFDFADTNGLQVRRVFCGPTGRDQLAQGKLILARWAKTQPHFTTPPPLAWTFELRGGLYGLG